MTNEEINEIKDKERYRIAKMIMKFANEAYHNSEKEYPSNVADMLYAMIVGINLSGHNKSMPKLAEIIKKITEEEKNV